jgi:PAS domain S-box-containing protein
MGCLNPLNEHIALESSKSAKVGDAERSPTDHERNCTVEFLSMVNCCTSLRELLQRSCLFFQEYSGCEAVAIRVRDGEDYPITEARGYSADFIERDRSLCCLGAHGGMTREAGGSPELACLCWSILQSRCRWVNERGTFWCQDIAAFEEALVRQDRTCLRGVCAKSEFSSLGLIPMGPRNQPAGLIQLASLKRGHFNSQSMAYWERLAGKFFIAVEKFQAQEALKIANSELEKRVRKRTAELEIKNSALAAEILQHEKTEAALRESEARFRLLAENSTDMIGRLTPEGECVYVSPASLGLLGFAPEELVGTTLYELCHPEDIPEISHYLLVLLKRLKPLMFTWRARRKSGYWIWLESSCRSVRDSKTSEVVEIQTASRDITVRKSVEGALKQSEDSLRTLSNNLPDGAIFQFLLKADGRSRYTFLSDSAKQLIGVPARELMKQPSLLLDLVLPQDIEALNCARKKAAQERSIFDHEARIRTPNGEIKWIHWRSAPRGLENGDTVWDGVITNVTQRRRGEEALQRANRALRVLKECDEALVRASGERELLERVCEILVEVGIAKMAWVGEAEQDSKKSVRPIACAGDTGPNGGFLQSLRITWADRTRGRGPTGTAIRTGQIVICHDLAAKRELKPWRRQYLAQQLVAVISLPLVVESCTLGALTIYSSETDAFNAEEVDLLQQLAGDLSFGISALRTRAKRQALEDELVRISEREKQLIAQELHDGLCQHLTGTAFLGSVLHRKLAARNAPETETAKQICDHLNLGASEARNLSHGLHPVRPEPEGLMDALCTLARSTGRLFQLRCIFRCAEPVSIQDPRVANHLFRIAQEALNNALKHGRASEVIIQLEKSPGGIALSIRDNGMGIPAPESRSTNNGMGLQIMSHRAAAIGASLSVQPVGKQGTMVRCSLALP